MPARPAAAVERPPASAPHPAKVRGGARGPVPSPRTPGDCLSPQGARRSGRRPPAGGHCRTRRRGTTSGCARTGHAGSSGLRVPRVPGRPRRAGAAPCPTWSQGGGTQGGGGGSEGGAAPAARPGGHVTLPARVRCPGRRVPLLSSIPVSRSRSFRAAGPARAPPPTLPPSWPGPVRVCGPDAERPLRKDVRTSGTGLWAGVTINPKRR